MGNTDNAYECQHWKIKIIFEEAGIAERHELRIYLNAKNVPTVPLRDLPQEEEMPVGVREYPIFYKFTGNGQFSCVPEAVLHDRPYPVRGLLVVGGSPALSFPDSAVWRAAYQKLKCMIVIDRYLTEDTRYADVVFPACTLFECPKVVSGPEGMTIQEPAIQPEYPFTMTSGARSNHRMGVFGANIPEIAAIEPFPLVDLNAEDAEELRISEGEMVKISTPFGSGEYKARICGIARHAIHIPHGGGSSYMAKPWKEGNFRKNTEF